MHTASPSLYVDLAMHRYAVNPGWTKTERKRRVMATHLELTSFFDNLPRQVRLPASPSQPAMPNIYVFQYVTNSQLFPSDVDDYVY